jgi:hypothetical protein
VTELPTFDWITEPQTVPVALKKLNPKQRVVCVICNDKARQSPLTHEATAQEHIAEIESLMSRQAMGRYSIAEIAKILAQENNLDEMKLLPRLQEAANDKKLTVTDPDTGGTPIAPNSQILIFNQWVHPKAVNALLASWHVNYQFAWPRPWHLQAAESALGNVHRSVLPPQKSTEKKLQKKTNGWRDIAWTYVMTTYQAGQYKTAKDLYKKLQDTAGLGDSPFKKGEGTLRGSLFIEQTSSSLASKTLANAWKEIKKSPRP